MELCVCGARLTWQLGEPPLEVGNVEDPLDFSSIRNRDQQVLSAKHLKMGVACNVRQGINRAHERGLVLVPYSKRLHEVISKLVGYKPETRVEILLDRSKKGLSYLLYVPEHVAIKISKLGEERLSTVHLIDLAVDLFTASDIDQDEIDFQVVMLTLDAIP